MTEYLIQDKSNVIFVSTPALKKRGDMRPYKMGTPVQAELQDNVPSSEDEEKETPIEEKPRVFDEKAAVNARAEMEAIEDPDEMIAFVFEKYGVKLPRTMKKATMIERALASVNENRELA